MYGDLRWGGSYGVDADFIASSNVIVKSIDLEKIQVNHMYNDEGCKFQISDDVRLEFHAHLFPRFYTVFNNRSFARGNSSIHFLNFSKEHQLHFAATMRIYRWLTTMPT